MILSKRALKRLIYDAMPKERRGHKLNGHRFIRRYRNNRAVEIILNQLSIRELLTLYKDLQQSGEIYGTLPIDQL